MPARRHGWPPRPYIAFCARKPPSSPSTVRCTFLFFVSLFLRFFGFVLLLRRGILAECRKGQAKKERHQHDYGDWF
jgi:hypothetical protein